MKYACCTCCTCKCCTCSRCVCIGWSCEELLGRGLGRWASEGPVLGFELDIFQYEAMSLPCHFHVTSISYCRPRHAFRNVARAPLRFVNTSRSLCAHSMLHRDKAMAKVTGFSQRQDIRTCLPQLVSLLLTHRITLQPCSTLKFHDHERTFTERKAK